MNINTGKTYCYHHDASGNIVSSVKADGENSVFDENVIILKWMHLAIFILLFFSTLNFTKQLNLNMQILKKFCMFITVPLYFWVIIDAYDSVHWANLNV